MPKAAYHFESLFPNNYLHTEELHDGNRLDNAATSLHSLLETGAGEREVLNFVNRNKYYFFIGGIMKSSYHFGHHAAYAFKEFAMPPNFVADYLLVGKSSGGYQFVFVELQSPTGAITNAGGSFGTTLRKGIKQIEDWDEWIDSNYANLELFFSKSMWPEAELPKEFRKLDKSRIHYTLVAGRRPDFKDKTYTLQRKLKKERNINLLHYDNLIDTLEDLKRFQAY